LFLGRILSFAAKEGAALAVSPSSQGDGGTLFVSAASLPGAGGRGGGGAPNAPRAWSTNAPSLLPQITLAAEDYNRLVRMIQEGERLKMAVDLQVQFHDEDLLAYNTLAEIPGSDLRDQIVMLGAHLDSWHSGTGATDNGAGVAATMEAVRILRALDLQPRRTIRIGLWTGEEQGLFGSKAYVAQHFGYYTNLTNAVASGSQTNQTDSPTRAGRPATRRLARAPRTPATSGEETAGASRSAPGIAVSTNGSATRTLVRGPEYERFSAYFNLDNGTGKIRGVYLQGNEAARPLFRRWLQPVNDLGAETLSLSGTGGTDHTSFDAIGLPGFQFIQDPLEYATRTHHSNADVFDRIQADDLKQAATIIAVFAYQAAMLDDKLPRKPLD
jgi:Zn-dependent M28 family amino/carboxypeptidase